MKKKLPLALAAGAISALAAGLTLWFLTKRKEYQSERPPKNAPQLRIENPGTQDEFPKPPIESELG